MEKTGNCKRAEARDSILISFSGIDGSGKSTQVERLSAQLAQDGIPVVQLAFWDHVVALPGLRAGFSHRYLQSEAGIGAPGKPVQRNDKNRRGWYLTLPRTLLYLVDALKLRRAVARMRAKHSGAIIFHRYIFDQLATLPVQNPLVQLYARLLLAITPQPDIAYLLDADPVAARARKPEYPLEFMKRYRQSYLDLRNLAGLVLIEPQSVENAQAAIVARLETRSEFNDADPTLALV